MDRFVFYRTEMRIYPRSITLIFLALASCNVEEIKQLESENQSLSSENESLSKTILQLQGEIDDLVYELDQVEKLSDDLERCEKNFTDYRFGEGYVLHRMTPTGMVRVYGADRIIDFLNSHYCMHWEWEISQDEVDRTQANPRIIR